MATRRIKESYGSELRLTPAMHDTAELNRYTGLFTGGCLLSRVFCVYALAKIGDALTNLHDDFRRVHSMDEREDLEDI
jgi:hypothetical protein